MAVVQSSVHANLNRDKILDETWWLYYCCCGGAGLGPISDPLIGAEVKELCIRATCTTTDMSTEEGLCSTMSVFCCITEHCQIPPMKGFPKCVCFNKTLAGPKAGDKISYKTSLFDYKTLFDETFWLYYMFCYGCGVSKPGAGRPLIGVQEKILIVQGSTTMEAPVGSDGTFCSAVATECCMWSQCQFPPAPNNPVIAICGWRKDGKKSKLNLSRPSQVEMS